MQRVYLGLGSNIGDRQGHLERARRQLASQLKIEKQSLIYESEPIQCLGGWFLNQVLQVCTQKSLGALWTFLHKIEQKLGRCPRKAGFGYLYSARTLDIDILFYGNHIGIHSIQKDGLIVPHPRLYQRRFVLEPLKELGFSFPKRGGHSLDDYLKHWCNTKSTYLSR